jgi:hypothetical protein
MSINERTEHSMSVNGIFLFERGWHMSTSECDSPMLLISKPGLVFLMKLPQI